MADKTFQSIDKYISVVLYWLLMTASYAFYYAATDVAQAVLKYDHTKNVWGYNAGGTLLISLLVLIVISTYTERRIQSKHAILTEDTPRKVLLTITNLIFAVTFVFASYITLDRFLHGEYKATFYINQLVKLLISGMFLTYYFRDLKRTIASTPLLMKTLGIGLIVMGLGLFATNLYFSPSLKDLRLKKEDEARLKQLGDCTKAIKRFAKSHKKLPQSLEEVIAQTGKPKALQDPITGENFIYKLKTPKSAEVCAIFHSPFPLEKENLTTNPTNPRERCSYIKENKYGSYDTTINYDSPYD
jgi:hypothetical protein